MAYLQPQDTNTDVEIKHLEKPSEIRQVETPETVLTDTVQPDTSDAQDTADRNPGVSAWNAQQEYIQSGIVAASLAVINSASEGL